MKTRILSILVAVLIVSVVGATAVMAEKNPNASAKATGAVNDLWVVNQADTSGGGSNPSISANVQIADLTIKTGGGKELLIGVSLQSLLSTTTNVKSSGGNKDTAEGIARLWVAVLVDDEIVYPGYPVVWNARTQELSAELQGIIGSVEDGTPVITANETIELFIETLSVNTFNFIAKDLDSGQHTIEVLAWTECEGNLKGTEQGFAAAQAVIGLGSVTVEEVRFVKDEIIYFPEPE